ncbi:hypothetical protein M6D93_05240 [Jatrophihabitans telluris]|uniref:Uncharacterized protein n=1 Tax=Jatrophihabitans telluris TaxID=2038343 RepID=A0ABY4R117_9ACTN|nr:hypothetical protein [Jatrophihabitans telluris]UQX89410.1 hypothetical protein M6D93_05240 [Jatrophihabitans telluris]
MTGFEIFTKRMVPLKRAPCITIQKRGAISINKSAFLALGEPDAVELMYDRAEHRVGLRAADPRLDHAYPVRQSGGGDNGPFVISAVAFTHFYDIDTSQSLRWEALLIDDVLYIDLDSKATPVTSNRAHND